jgi:uncharacterized protein with PIN domain
VEQFIVDHMLMRLGRWLRLLGMNVANPDDADDQKLLQIAKQEHRVLLTRDRKLANTCFSKDVDCILILSSDIEHQLSEMAEHGIILELNPKRCTICNNLLDQEIQSYSEKELWICQACGKAYWKGSHWTNMEKVLEKIRSVKISN